MLLIEVTIFGAGPVRAVVVLELAISGSKVTF